MCGLWKSLVAQHGWRFSWLTNELSELPDHGHSLTHAAHVAFDSQQYYFSYEFSVSVTVTQFLVFQLTYSYSYLVQSGASVLMQY